MEFEKRYKALNHEQRKAVDAIDGPVMVIAGPGTGKTELLSVRVANILKKTDALPQNILCLTFTESGAYAMRERLAGLIGPEAYKVAVHTFHSFGTEIINQNSEYFYNGAHFRPADELSTYETLRDIFEKLPHNNPLATTMNDEFTYLRDTQRAISDLKKSGLTNDELLEIIDRNEAFIDWIQPKLQAVFAQRLSKKVFPAVQDLLDELANYSEKPYELITYHALHESFATTLKQASDDSEADGSTKPLSAWKRDWCEKRTDGEITLKDEKRSRRLRAVGSIYYEYLLAMQKKALYDFDDMILRVVHGLELFNDLRLNLQERYQYILVDEFQDTNDAQMRIIWNLTNNLAQDGRPNIMVVGDDDQAIYRFQGANVANIIDFKNLYRGVETITLKDNYRSNETILAIARSVITQAENRLETTFDNVDKTLRANRYDSDVSTEFVSYPDELAEYSQVAERIARIKNADSSSSVAIIARNHRQIKSLLPFLEQNNVPTAYSSQDDVLNSPPTKLLVLLARVVDRLSAQDFVMANALLPELLAHPAWNIATKDLWNLSLTAHRERRMWLEIMLATEGTLNQIAEWLIVCSHMALTEPLEYILDILTGSMTSQSADSSEQDSDDIENELRLPLTSPLRNYYFSTDKVSNETHSYVTYLRALSSLRKKLREYLPDAQLQLRDCIHFIDTHEQLGITIESENEIMNSDENPVNLLTAHRAKGLEFDYVFVISLTENIWGLKAKGQGSKLSYPHNLPIGPGGDGMDEQIRLLFVALTRARSHLLLSTHRASSAGKDLMQVGYLAHQKPEQYEATATELEQQVIMWHERLSRAPQHDLKQLLGESLKKYKLSATHLTNFLDVTKGGPERFLLQNLLRFPQPMGPSAAYGSAVHATLQRAHSAYSATGKKRPVEDLLGDFERELANHHLSHVDFDYFLKRGSDNLSAFFNAKYNTFSRSQQVERSFATDYAQIDGARLTGALDLIDIDEKKKAIIVTDYKTGKPSHSWQGRTEYEKIKLHHYRQQLLFYKLLIENSRLFAGYRVEKGVIEFVEPDERGDFHRIEFDYDEKELSAFTLLLTKVWHAIQNLEFRVENDYPQNLKGILAFEDDLTA